MYNIIVQMDNGSHCNALGVSKTVVGNFADFFAKGGIFIFNKKGIPSMGIDLSKAIGFTVVDNTQGE